MAGQLPVIRGAVEGIVDEAVFGRLVRSVGAEPGPVYGKMGKRRLVDHLAGYNNAARFSPWFVLVDLDRDADCAPPFTVAILPAPARWMSCRVAVREVEAWILADRERLASFLDVDEAWLPRHPDSERDPKQVVVNLARRSHNRDISRDLVPREGSGRSEGPAYAGRLVEFVSDQRHGWRPTVAARSSDSLARCVLSLRRLVRAARGTTRS